MDLLEQSEEHETLQTLKANLKTSAKKGTAAGAKGSERCEEHNLRSLIVFTREKTAPKYQTPTFAFILWSRHEFFFHEQCCAHSFQSHSVVV